MKWACKKDRENQKIVTIKDMESCGFHGHHDISNEREKEKIQ